MTRHGHKLDDGECQDADLLAAVEAEDCFSEDSSAVCRVECRVLKFPKRPLKKRTRLIAPAKDCESADGLALAQLRASYLKAEAEAGLDREDSPPSPCRPALKAAPKYQYYGADELDFDAAIQDTADCQ